MDELLVGIVGCGAIAPKHVEAIAATPGMRLAAVCDLIRERAERFGVPSYTEWRRMLVSAEPDLVAVCTPNATHWHIATQAANWGCKVIVEKPVAIGVSDLRAVNHRRDIFPMLQVRENLAVKALLAAIPHLGRIYSCALVQRWSRNQAYYDAAPWRGKVAEAGGSLYTQGVHYIDVMTQAMGPAREVEARMATLTHETEVEDELVASFEFQSGAVGTYSFSLNAPTNSTSLEIVGADGSVTLDGAALNHVGYWAVPGMGWPGVDDDEPNAYGGAYQGSPANHAAIYANVADHLLRGAPIHHTLESAIPALEFIEKAYQSARGA